MTPIPEKCYDELRELISDVRRGIKDDVCIYDFISNLREEDMKKLEDLKAILKTRLQYCEEQNGRDYCKNCGLCEEDFS